MTRRPLTGKEARSSPRSNSINDHNDNIMIAAKPYISTIILPHHHSRDSAAASRREYMCAIFLNPRYAGIRFSCSLNPHKNVPHGVRGFDKAVVCSCNDERLSRSAEIDGSEFLE